MLGLCAYETPDASVGKIFVSSILPDIHRCLGMTGLLASLED